MKTWQKTILAVLLGIAASIVWIVQLPPVPAEWLSSTFSEPKSTFAIDLVDMTLPSLSWAIEQYCEMYGAPPTGSTAEVLDQLRGNNPRSRRFSGESPLMQIREEGVFYQGTPFHIEVAGDSNLVRIALQWSGPNGQLGDGDDDQSFSVIRRTPPDFPKMYNTDTWRMIYFSEHTPPPANVDHLQFSEPPD